MNFCMLKVMYSDMECREHVSQIPQFILLRTETRGWREKIQNPIKVNGEFVDDAFIVDFVRVFDKVE